jgi:hypothetical protein
MAPSKVVRRAVTKYPSKKQQTCGNIERSLGTRMTEVIDFRIFPDDNQCKLDRNGEFVAVFSSREAATEAAEGYLGEISKNGGVATVRVEPTVEGRSVQPQD